jgi:hypothetical protein
MTTTTSKNVRGGAPAPAKQAAKQPAPVAVAKPARKPKAMKPAAEKAEEPKRGPLMIVIDGAGTMPLMDNNGRRVMRGEPVEVSEEEIDWLARGNSAFTRV